MKKILFTKGIALLLLGMIGCATVHAQRFSLEDIPLTWNDFKVKKDFSQHPFTAKIYTLTPLRYHFESEGNISKLVINTELKVNHDKSWVKKEFMDTASAQQKKELLNHEKGHMIIALIHHKKLQQLFSQFHFDKKRLKFQIDSLYKNVDAAGDKINARYDDETNHMLVADKQRAWIEDLLHQLNDVYVEDKKIALKAEMINNFQP